MNSCAKLTADRGRHQNQHPVDAINGDDQEIVAHIVEARMAAGMDDQEINGFEIDLHHRVDYVAHAVAAAGHHIASNVHRPHTRT